MFWKKYNFSPMLDKKPTGLTPGVFWEPYQKCEKTPKQTWNLRLNGKLRQVPFKIQ